MAATKVTTSVSRRHTKHVHKTESAKVDHVEDGGLIHHYSDVVDRKKKLSGTKSTSVRAARRCYTFMLIVFAIFIISRYMDMHVNSFYAIFSVVGGGTQNVLAVRPMAVQLMDTPNNLARVQRARAHNINLFDTKGEYRDQEKLVNSEDRYGQKYDRKMDGCVPVSDWQIKSYPTCNMLHEYDISYDDEATIVGTGAYRETWKTTDITGEAMALKTLRLSKEYSGYTFERHIGRHLIDALAMERLTASPYVVDIFAFCGNAGVMEFGDGGSMHSYQQQKVHTSAEDFKVILEAARGLADFHSIDERPSIVHNDVKPSQFIRINGVYKLNDFNKAKYLLYNESTGKKCHNKNVVPSSTGTFRSPEEYKGTRLTEKVDVYALGNSIYTILAGSYPFEGMRNTRVHKIVIDGARAILPDHVLNSEDPYVKALVRAMKLSQIHDPEKRASARDIADLLGEVLDTVG